LSDLEKARVLVERIRGMAPGERREFLRRACDVDTDLAGSVEELLSQSGETLEDLVTLQFQVPSTDARSPNLSGQRGANRYSVIGTIGRGGFGSVYRAYDDLLEREIALKVLHFSPGLAEEQRLQKLLSEARTVARLDHRHIVPIYDAGLEEATLWLAMRLLQGRSLDAILRDDGILDVSGAVRLLSPIARALDHAHERRIVHRDVKPSNILVEHLGTEEEHSWLDLEPREETRRNTELYGARADRGSKSRWSGRCVRTGVRGLGGTVWNSCIWRRELLGDHLPHRARTGQGNRQARAKHKPGDRERGPAGAGEVG
jgi:hypothetical protein